MDKKVVLAGGTGFVGKYFTTQFANLGYEVIIISRQKGNVHWDDVDGMINAIENAEIVVNLAGRSVDCRYNEKNRAEILSSRTETTKAIGNAIEKCTRPPGLWINSSTATIYRSAADRPMTESTGEIGEGFSVDVAKQWEKTFFSFQLSHTRQVALRISIVLGNEGGAFPPLKNLVRFGLGGKQGNGKQMFSWIHIEDLFRIIMYVHSHPEINGAINCSTPNPIDNKTLMKEFREAMNVKIGLPSPVWLLELGAVFIRTETELILKSRWVVPERLIENGFEFKYPTIDTALDDILGGG